MKRVILHPQKSALFSGLCERKSLFFDMYNTGSEKHTNLALANQLPLKQGLRLFGGWSQIARFPFSNSSKTRIKTFLDWSRVLFAGYH